MILVLEDAGFQMEPLCYGIITHNLQLQKIQYQQMFYSTAFTTFHAD